MSTPASSIRLWANLLSSYEISYPQLPPQWMDAIARSPCCFTLPICSLTEKSVLLDKSLNRFTPGLLSVAAQNSGMPLVPDPKENTSTLPFPATSTTAGDSASRRSLPAPELFRPAFFNVSRVSMSPVYPQSRTWLFEREQQSIRAAVRQGI